MFDPEKWSVFAASIVGVAAALIGLFVVAVSVRLDIVTRRRAAAVRGGQALLLLTMPFVAGALVLVPHQPGRLLGLEPLPTAGVFGAALLLLNRRALAHPDRADHLARGLQVVPPHVATTVALAQTGASLALE